MRTSERNRATGKTTRSIDEAIQFLFKNGKVQFGGDNPDIIDEPKYMYGQRYLLNATLKRLRMEHRYDVAGRAERMTQVDYRYNKMSIKLLDHPNNIELNEPEIIE